MAYRDSREVCAAWATTDDLCACLDEIVEDCATGEPTALTYPWTDDDLLKAASDYLYQKTCYKYSGVCESTFYPCVDCSCGNSHPCGCGVYRAIDLGLAWPVRSVSEITINDVVLDAALYRVDDYSRIVRVDGECWPVCNTLDANGDNVGDSLKVTASYGIAPPILLKMAVVEIACQFKKSCEGKPCEIDQGAAERIRSLTRRGVSIEVESVIDLVAAGLTGNAIVDQALSVYGECGKGSLMDLTQARRFVNVDTNIP